MSETAIKFTLTSGDVDFYKEEILNHDDQPQQEIEIQRNQQGGPVLFFKGQSWNVMPIIFIEEWASTRDKIQRLIDEEDEMTLYYAYASAGVEKSLNVILIPSGIKEVRFYGDREAKNRHVLTFLESSK